MPPARSAPDPQAGRFRLGVVEGFFGRAWSADDRLAWADFLVAQGFDSYVYAPKNDPLLRKAWHQNGPPPWREELRALCAHYRERGLDFGIGLSPYELYREFPDKREHLRDKLRELDEIGPTTLYILFDDMQGDLPDLARRQADIMDFVMTESRAARFALCPTYYSSDPILARQFGAEPAHYLDDLGRLLDPAVEVFWTGPRVLSHDYPEAHLREVGALLRRRPLIWDNYPVNDARRLTSFLHLRPPTRDPAIMRAHCSGHLANPMNESWLSRIPLHGLAARYRGEPAALERACLAICGEAVGGLLLEDAARFQDVGLDGLGAAEKRALRARYAAHPDNPCAREVVEWLDGVYTFDPACLT